MDVVFSMLTGLLPSLMAIVLAILLLFITKPEKKWIVIVCIVLIIASNGWGVYSKHSDERIAFEKQNRAYARLANATKAYLTWISIMVEAASDGWLPSNEDDLLSEKSAYIICNHLNADKSAPTFPNLPWGQWFGILTDRYRRGLAIAAVDSCAEFSADLIKAISAAENSYLLDTAPRWPNERLHQKLYLKSDPPPLICYGKENEVEKSFKELHSVLTQLRKDVKQKNLDSKTIPTDIQPAKRTEHFGMSRYIGMKTNNTQSY